MPNPVQTIGTFQFEATYASMIAMQKMCAITHWPRLKAFTVSPNQALINQQKETFLEAQISIQIQFDPRQYGFKVSDGGCWGP